MPIEILVIFLRVACLTDGWSSQRLIDRGFFLVGYQLIYVTSISSRPIDHTAHEDALVIEHEGLGMTTINASASVKGRCRHRLG